MMAPFLIQILDLLEGDPISLEDLSSLAGADQRSTRLAIRRLKSRRLASYTPAPRAPERGLCRLTPTGRAVVRQAAHKRPWPEPDPEPEPIPVLWEAVKVELDRQGWTACCDREGFVAFHRRRRMLASGTTIGELIAAVETLQD
jgi:hypothetical protein